MGRGAVGERNGGGAMRWRSGLEDYLAGRPSDVPADQFVWNVQAPEQEPNMELYRLTSETTIRHAIRDATLTCAEKPT